MYPKLGRTLRVGFMAGLAMGSLGLCCNGLCLSAFLAADGSVLYLSCVLWLS